MNTTGDTHPKVLQQDHETTKSEPTRIKDEVMLPTPDVPKLSIREIRIQLCNMQMVSWQLVSNIHSHINVIQKQQALERSNLSKIFRDCHHLLEMEEEGRMAESMKQEDQAVQRLEEETLQLVRLIEQIENAKTMDQLSAIEEKLKTLEKPEEELEINEPPLHLRNSKQMMHMVKPVPEQIQFDPQSAHRNLALSPDFKQVRFVPVPQRQTTPQCFQPGLYVLGTPGFKYGRHYWEVNVGHKSNWIVGVVKESVERKGLWEVNASNGYWALRKQENVYYGLGNMCEVLKYHLHPRRIGVCLDLFKSRLIFYDASTTDLVHQMSLGFVKETLVPLFCPGFPRREDDWCPLTICA